jgi:hypothetical protein
MALLYTCVATLFVQQRRVEDPTLVGIALWRYPVFFISLKRTAEDDEGFPTAGALVKSRP